jgi:hypothetical protein
MSTFVWSVVTGLEGRAPPTSEGSSLVLHKVNGEDFLVSFGGYSGRYSNEARLFHQFSSPDAYPCILLNSSLV